jgi:hypothetical protein
MSFVSNGEKLKFYTVPIQMVYFIQRLLSPGFHLNLFEFINTIFVTPLGEY